MSLTYEETKEEPIARVINTERHSSKFLYLDSSKTNKPINSFEENVRDNDFRSSKNGMLNPKIQQIIMDSVKAGYTDEQIRKIAQIQYDLLENRRDEGIGNELQLGTGEMLTIMPSVLSERIFMGGRSGSGKSTISARYAHEYKKMFPDREIIMFTPYEDDPAYEGLNMKLVKLDENILDIEIPLESLYDSLCIFDDTDNLPDKRIGVYVNALFNNILCNGRKKQIHVIYLAHLLLNYSATRTILTEANKVVFFLNGPSFQNDSYMKKYGSLNKENVQKVNELNSRWAMYSVTSRPPLILHEHGAFIIKNKPKK